jgi:hypothetical protein
VSETTFESTPLPPFAVGLGEDHILVDSGHLSPKIPPEDRVAKSLTSNMARDGPPSWSSDAGTTRPCPHQIPSRLYA